MGSILNECVFHARSDHYDQILLRQVARHIFTGPSTAHGSDSRGVRSSNASLHRMEKVEATHIAYATVLVSLHRSRN